MILNRQSSDLELIGVFVNDDKFLCTECAPEDVLDDSMNTVIMSYDEWFEGEICTKCQTLVERTK